MVTVKIYRRAPAKIGQIVMEKEMLPELFSVCESLSQQYQSMEKSSLIEIKKQLAQLSQQQEVAEKWIKIQLDKAQKLDWQEMLTKLLERYPQLIWTQVSKTQTTQGETVYYFRFIPLAINKAAFPFTVSLKKALAQQTLNRETNSVVEFQQTVARLAKEFVKNSAASKKQQILKTKRRRNTSNVVQMQEKSTPASGKKAPRYVKVGVEEYSKLLQRQTKREAV